MHAILPYYQIGIYLYNAQEVKRSSNTGALTQLAGIPHIVIDPFLDLYSD